MSSHAQNPCSTHMEVHVKVITSRRCVHCKRDAVCFCCSPAHCQFHTTTTCNYYSGLYVPGHRSHGRSPTSNRDELCWCCTCIVTGFTCINRHCQFHESNNCNVQNNPSIGTLCQKQIWKGIKIIDEYEFNSINLKIHSNIQE